MPTGADFIVQGNVRMVPIAGGQQRVEIQWAVKAASGDERGKVVQLNDIPAGTLDHYWADVAMVVATEAAGGVNDVITAPVRARAGRAGSWTGAEAVGRRPQVRRRAGAMIPRLLPLGGRTA